MTTLPPLPYIPLEVAENIIDQLSGHVRSLCSCALICRGWNRHARCHLIAAIRVQSRDDLYSVFHYITSNPHVASTVWGLSVAPPGWSDAENLLEVLPVDLLKRLPFLQRYSISGSDSVGHRISFHATTLMHMKTYLLVEDLHLARLKFSTGAELARVLIALTRLRQLKCDSVEIGLETVGTGIEQFRSKCSKLSEVTVSGSRSGPGLGGLLAQMSLSALTVVRYDIGEWWPTHRAPDLSQLEHLHFLELIAHDRESVEHTFDRIISIITTLPPHRLRTLTISFKRHLPQNFKSKNQIAHQLDEAIFAMGTPSVVVSIPTKRNRLAQWSKSIGSRLPRLHKVGLLEIQCSAGDHFGHDAIVTAIAVSPDCRYIATAANDGTVIIWNRTTSRGSSFIEIQCPAQSPHAQSLQFSNTGDFLAARCGEDILIWGAVDGVQVVSIAIPAEESIPPYLLTTAHVQPLLTGVHESDAPVISALCQAVLRRSVHGGRSSIATSPSGRFIAEYKSYGEYRSGSIINIWSYVGDSTPGGYEQHQLTYPSNIWLKSVIFAGDSDELLIGGSGSGHIIWWDISSLPLAITEPSGALARARGALTDTSRTLFDGGISHNAVFSLSISPLYSFLAAVCHHLGAPRNWVVAVLQRADSFGQHGALNAGFERPHVFLCGHTDKINVACFSPNERYIATASEDTTVRLWSSRDGELLWTFRDHVAAVRHVCFSSDGQFLVSGDKGGEVFTHYVPMFVRDASLASVDHS